jgi:hypothetical protein
MPACRLSKATRAQKARAQAVKTRDGRGITDWGWRLTLTIGLGPTAGSGDAIAVVVCPVTHW